MPNEVYTLTYGKDHNQHETSNEAERPYNRKKSHIIVSIILMNSTKMVIK